MTSFATPAAVEGRTASNEIRWAAAALIVGGLLFVGGIVLGLAAFAGDWDRTVGLTLPTTAGIIRDNWPAFRRIWFGEMCAALLIAVASFLFQSSTRANKTRIPLGMLWIIVGVGSILVAVQYAFTLGSYPPVLAAFEQEPTLFAAVRGGVLSVSAVGSVLQLGGLLTIMLIELRWKAVAASHKVIQGATAIALCGIALAALGLMPGEYGAAGIFLGSAVLGAAMWLRSAEQAEHTDDQVAPAA